MRAPAIRVLHVPIETHGGGRVDRHGGPSRGGEGGDALADDRAIERDLASEVVVDHRLVHAGAGGEAIDPGAAEAVGGELHARGLEDEGPRIAGDRGTSHWNAELGLRSSEFELRDLIN